MTSTVPTETVRTDYVTCESADGWSLHAPGSTDEQIASGDAPALVSGPWETDDQTIPAWAYAAALDDDGIATRLADLLDDAGGWDWGDGAETDPSDRYAVVESSGAWWLVYRGTEADDAVRYDSRDAARAALAGATS